MLQREDSRKGQEEDFQPIDFSARLSLKEGTSIWFSSMAVFFQGSWYHGLISQSLFRLPGSRLTFILVVFRHNQHNGDSRRLTQGSSLDVFSLGQYRVDRVVEDNECTQQA